VPGKDFIWEGRSDESSSTEGGRRCPSLSLMDSASMANEPRKVSES
jgi:hypothetical protein